MISKNKLLFACKWLSKITSKRIILVRENAMNKYNSKDNFNNKNHMLNATFNYNTTLKLFKNLRRIRIFG